VVVAILAFPTLSGGMMGAAGLARIIFLDWTVQLSDDHRAAGLAAEWRPRRLLPAFACVLDLSVVVPRGGFARRPAC